MEPVSGYPRSPRGGGHPLPAHYECMGIRRLHPCHSVNGDDLSRRHPRNRGWIAGRAQVQGAEDSGDRTQLSRLDTGHRSAGDPHRSLDHHGSDENGVWRCHYALAEGSHGRVSRGTYVEQTVQT